MFSIKQQTFEILNKSQQLLIVLPKDSDADQIGSGLALAIVAQNLEKKVDIILPDALPKKLSFLPAAGQIKNEPSGLRQFIISVSTNENQIKQLRYEASEGMLKIFLSSQGKIEEKDLRLEPGPFVYDLMVVIGAADLESLGHFHENHTELFFENPILNIDYRGGNEFFGEINLVEPTASSCSEIMADFLNTFFPAQITGDVATCLLAGIIDETHSFQKANTTPQTFNLASLLVAQGAEKEKIIQALYKTKPLNSLKLWGKLLDSLEWQAETNIAWLEAKADDFTETQTSPKDLLFISEEIQDLLPQLKISLVIYGEDSGFVSVLAHSARPDLLQKMHLDIGGTIKNNYGLFKILAANALEAKSKILGLLNPLL